MRVLFKNTQEICDFRAIFKKQKKEEKKELEEDHGQKEAEKHEEELVDTGGKPVHDYSTEWVRRASLRSDIPIIALDAVKEWPQARFVPNQRKSKTELAKLFPHVNFEYLDSENDEMFIESPKAFPNSGIIVFVNLFYYFYFSILCWLTYIVGKEKFVNSRNGLVIGCMEK